MGHVLSLYTVYELARVTVPSFLELYVREIPHEEADRRIADCIERVVARARIRLTVEGHERVPSDRAFVYMSNHQSHMDIPVLYATMPAESLRMVAKKELFRIPFWGKVLRAAGFVEIDRHNRSKAIASLGQAEQLLQSGVSVWIAPEGSRSRTGKLGPLKKGGFYLAKNAGAPIVPVALQGTRHILPPGTTSMVPDCLVKVTFGVPIPVAGREIPDLVAEVEAFLKAHNGEG